MRNIEKQLVVNHVHAFKYYWRLRRKGRRITVISYFGMFKECKEKSAIPMDSSTTCSPIIFFRFLLHNAISMRANQKEWLIREYCLRCNLILLFIDRVPCFHLQCRLGEDVRVELHVNQDSQHSMILNSQKVSKS